jgi:hypothetical protein
MAGGRDPRTTLEGLDMATADTKHTRRTRGARHRASKTVAVAVSASLACTALPVFAAQTISCASSGYRYTYCRVDTDNEVRLERQRSSTECRQGYSWGYDRHGVWVDRGCAADFRVGHDGGGHGSRNKALAVGAVAGIALLAAMAAQGNKGQQSADVASWAVGTFSGYDPVVGSDVELTILPGGSVSGRAGSTAFEGHLAGSVLKTERQSFRLERQGNAFVAIDERDANHRVVYRRSGGGY